MSVVVAELFSAALHSGAKNAYSSCSNASVDSGGDFKLQRPKITLVLLDTIAALGRVPPNGRGAAQQHDPPSEHVH